MKTITLKQVAFALAILFMFNAATAKVKTVALNGNDIKWTTIEQAVSNAKSDNKKFILVDLYTDWCGWCKKMDENAYQDGGVVGLMNENFTAVKFNAESPNSITFNGKSYPFVKTGARGANQLALDLGSIGGKLGYPTIVVLDETGKKLQSFPGYKDVETLTAILKYFKSGSYKTMDFQQFQSGQ
ncbi:MAG TPA: DUF255 domain-containing protein [Chitinophagales bacterium]|nr:DUF255 domain-containing protein [Chitinophagales bacterium]HNM32221.1 DUF255 domain-containing protein [Chitinophagales bacterium]